MQFDVVVPMYLFASSKWGCIKLRKRMVDIIQQKNLLLRFRIILPNAYLASGQEQNTLSTQDIVSWVDIKSTYSRLIVLRTALFVTRTYFGMSNESFNRAFKENNSLC